MEKYLLIQLYFFTYEPKFKILLQNSVNIKMASLTGVLTKFHEEYSNNTPKKLKIIDAYLTYIFFTGVVQFVYCCLVGTFPFNAFLSGFISSVASFVLGVCLRLQVIFFKTFNYKTFGVIIKY